MRITKTDQYSRGALLIIFIIMTLFLLASESDAYSVSKVPAVCMLILLITAFILGKFHDLPKTIITPVVISVTAYIVIYTVSLFYATTGQFALTVFSYYLGGVSLFMLTILLVNRDAMNTRHLLSILAFSVGIAGIFSIDAASIRILTPGLESALSSLLNSEPIHLGAFETGTRMTSIINHPNVFGSLAALGTLAAAYLFLSGSSRKEKNISSGLLIVNAVSLLYCFSLGSLIGMFFAVIGLIVFAGTETRPRTVYVTLSTVIIAFLSVFAGFTGMGKSGITAVLPLLSLLIFGFVLAFVLRYTDKFTSRVIVIGRKKILIILLIVILIALAFAGAALTISKPYTYDASGAALRRAVTLETGDYQLEVGSSNPATVTNILIESQSYDQASTHTSTTLFNGAMENGIVAFTVPIDSNICFINITAAEGTVIEGIHIFDANRNLVESVKPDYLLLPSFMANRLQGVFVNENAAQRFVFFKDGLKIAAMNPIIGQGPGAFESNILSVQDYYYTTKGAHNHYIQTLDEVGIIGLLAFLSIIIFSIIAMVKKVRTTKNRALYSVLFAMLIMIIIHTAIELTFSFGFYNMAAFMIFALISSEYGQKELSVKEAKKAAPIPRIAKNAVLALCTVILMINLGQFAAIKTVNTSGYSGDELKFLDTLSFGTVLDFTNDISYKTTYINAYTTDLPESYYEKSLKYAGDLEKHNSFGAFSELVNYYIKIGDNEKAYRALNNRQALLRYNDESWNQTFDFYRAKMAEAASAADPDTETGLVKEYASAAYDQLDAYLAESPLDIELSEENQQFREIIQR